MAGDAAQSRAPAEPASGGSGRPDDGPARRIATLLPEAGRSAAPGGRGDGPSPSAPPRRAATGRARPPPRRRFGAHRRRPLTSPARGATPPRAGCATSAPTAGHSPASRSGLLVHRRRRPFGRATACAHPGHRDPAGVDGRLDLPDPDGHLQAIGRDARGRRQYRYHAGFRARRDRGKFARLVRFGERLPRIRRRVARRPRAVRGCRGRRSSRRSWRSSRRPGSGSATRSTRA